MTRRGGLGAAQVALLSQQPAMFSAILAATATGTGTRVDDPVNRVDAWGLEVQVCKRPADGSPDLMTATQTRRTC